MTEEEWESLCDGCGKCCLHKLMDEDTDEIYYTNVACSWLNSKTCSCKDYPNRFTSGEECTKLTREDIRYAEELGYRIKLLGITRRAEVDGKVGIEYGVYGVPETYLIDREGIIRYKHVGALTPALLNRTLLPLIEKWGAP